MTNKYITIHGTESKDRPLEVRESLGQETPNDSINVGHCMAIGNLFFTKKYGNGMEAYAVAFVWCKGTSDCQYLFFSQGVLSC